MQAGLYRKIVRWMIRSRLGRGVCRTLAIHLWLTTKALPVLIECTGIVFTVTAGAAFAMLWAKGVREELLYLRVAFEPAIAGIALVLTGLIAPNIVRGWQIRGALVLTIPLYYTVLVGCVAVLNQASELGVRAGGGPGRFDVIWLHPRALAAVLLGEVAVMAFVAWVSKWRSAPGKVGHS